MIREFFIKLISQAKEVAKVLKSKFIALTNKLMPSKNTKFLLNLNPE
jgi:hypothetical protein